MAFLTDILGRGESAGTAREDIIPYLGTLLPWGGGGVGLQRIGQACVCIEHPEPPRRIFHQWFRVSGLFLP